MAESPMDTSLGAAHRTAGPRRSPQICRFGASTLDQPFPEWLGAWDSPWTCRHPSHSGPLETAETCATCRDWRPRQPPDDRRSH